MNELTRAYIDYIEALGDTDTRLYRHHQTMKQLPPRIAYQITYKLLKLGAIEPIKITQPYQFSKNAHQFQHPYCAILNAMVSFKISTDNDYLALPLEYRANYINGVVYMLQSKLVNIIQF